MADLISTERATAFGAEGFRRTVDKLILQIQQLYSEDQIPWVVGYSGGKDSTATLQLVWLALEALPTEARQKEVFVISTDTLVENPVVAAWVTHSLETMERVAGEKQLPIFPNRLTPDVRDTFWVNLIGKGYPAPRPKFRWCTERLKIKPADRFINNLVQQNGEAIVVLGTRKAESSVRAARMNSLERQRKRDHLNPHSSLPNAYVYAPIHDWANDDVWMFLMQVKNPWGYNNKDLLTMYQGATPDAECPLVIDTSTPSCGDSRFGCWVCTLVGQDKSMTAMIKNDEEKSWMEPLLRLRNELDAHDHDKRDFRRMSGAVQLIKDSENTVPGPYTQESREAWLRQLLTAQQTVRANPRTPEHVKDIELISLEELHEVRRLWVVEKYEIEDSVPRIYEETTGMSFPSRPLDGSQPFASSEMQILRNACSHDPLQFELLRELLEIERRFRGMSKRARLFERLESAFRKSFYDDAADASARAVSRRRMEDRLKQVREQGLGSSEMGALVDEIENRAADAN